MAIFKWSVSGSGWINCFDASDLNSLASTGQKTSSLSGPLIDNSAGDWLSIEFELTFASLSPTSGANVLIVLKPELSAGGGAYPTGADGTTLANQIPILNYPHAVCLLTTQAATAQSHQVGPIPLPPRKFHPALINRAAVALAASGNQVKYRLLTERAV